MMGICEDCNRTHNACQSSTVPCWKNARLEEALRNMQYPLVMIARRLDATAGPKTTFMDPPALVEEEREMAAQAPPTEDHTWTPIGGYPIEWCSTCGAWRWILNGPKPAEINYPLQRGA